MENNFDDISPEDFVISSKPSGVLIETPIQHITHITISSRDPVSLVLKFAVHMRIRLPHITKLSRLLSNKSGNIQLHMIPFRIS